MSAENADLVKVDQAYKDDVSSIKEGMDYWRDDFLACAYQLSLVINHPIWAGQSFEHFKDAKGYLDTYVKNVEQCRKDIITAIDALNEDTKNFVDNSVTVKWVTGE